MMNPSYPAGNGGSGGGPGGGTDLGPLTQRVEAIEAYGVEATVPTIATAASTPKAGTAASTLAELFPGFPEEASFLLAPDGMPTSTVTLQSWTAIGAVPSLLWVPALSATVVETNGLVSLVIASTAADGKFDIVGDAADRMGLSGSHAPGTATVRRIAAASDVDHPAGGGSVGQALAAVEATLASIRVGTTQIRVPEDMSLYSAMYAAKGGVAGALTQIVINTRSTVDNLVVDGDMSGVEIIAGYDLFPVYLGSGLSVSRTGGRGGWTVTVSGIESYVDLTLIEPGDRIEFAAQYATPFTGAASEELAGEWPVVSVDPVARTVSFEINDIRNLTSSTCSLAATVVRCRITGYPSPYHAGVVDIRPAGSLGSIGGICLVAPPGYATAGMVVSGRYLGTTYWSSTYDTLRCAGSYASGLDVRAGGSAYSKRLIASGEIAGVSAKGPVVTEEATLSAGGSPESAGLLLGIGGRFTTKPGFLSIRGARMGVSTVTAVDLTASVGIAGNGDPGDPQVFASDGGRAIVTGTTYPTSPSPNALSADGSYIKRSS